MRFWKFRSYIILSSCNIHTRSPPDGQNSNPSIAAQTPLLVTILDYEKGDEQALEQCMQMSLSSFDLQGLQAQP